MFRALFTFVFFNDTATTEIYTLSLHDALPIYLMQEGMIGLFKAIRDYQPEGGSFSAFARLCIRRQLYTAIERADRKSTRLNSSHANISYAVFCLKKKNASLAPLLLQLLA